MGSICMLRPYENRVVTTLRHSGREEGHARQSARRERRATGGVLVAVVACSQDKNEGEGNGA